MIGTSAFESIVPNIVAARRLAVARRAIGRGTRASLKRMPHRPSANAADSVRPPERLRRSRESVDRAHSPHRRCERTGGHSRPIARARRVDRGPEDRAGRLRPGTRRDRTQDPHGLLQLARPQTPLRASPTAPRGVSATPAHPRRGSDRALDVQASAVLLGALLAMELKERVPILTTADKEQTALVLKVLWKSQDKVAPEYVLRHKPKTL